jgi:hypothetical protein
MPAGSLRPLAVMGRCKSFIVLDVLRIIFMPRITMETLHKLGREEAARRLKDKFSAVRALYGAQVNNLRETWTDHTLSFGFKTMGMGVSGTVHVGESNVKLDCDLPLAAFLFKGTIEQRIHEELGDILA